MFWELQIYSVDELATNEDFASNPTETFSLNSIWNFNSRKDTKFQTMFAQVGTPLYCWVPEKQINNHDSKLFLEHKDLLIQHKVRFIELVDGSFWVVNDDTIENFLLDLIAGC